MAARRGNPPALKRLGQHFLVDQDALHAIAEAVDPSPGDTIIEIGPGRGALTDILAERDNDLIAVEIDRALSAQLRERYASNTRVRVIEDDFLKVDVAPLIHGSHVVVGNVPYYITTPIIFKVLQHPLPRHAVFLVQREVAERIVSGPGSREYGALSVNVQAIASAEIVRNVGPRSFKPPPKVDSSVIRITPRPDPIIATDEIARFRGFVQGLFGMRRKQIANGLRSVAQLTSERTQEVLASVNIDPQARAETLTPSQLAELMRAAQQPA